MDAVSDTVGRPSDGRWLTTSEVSQILRRDRRTVCRMCEDGRLQARRRGPRAWEVWSASVPGYTVPPEAGESLQGADVTSLLLELAMARGECDNLRLRLASLEAALAVAVAGERRAVAVAAALRSALDSVSEAALAGP